MGGAAVDHARRHRALRVAVAAAHAASRAHASQISQCPWLNTSLPAKTRVNMLVSHMTLEQQASLMKVSPGSGATAGMQVVTPAIPSLCLPAETQADGPRGW